MIIVASLIVVALIVAAVLYRTLNEGDIPDDLPDTTVVPGEDTGDGDSPDSGDAATDADPPEGSGPVSITEVQAWDPDGSNRTENDAQAPLALADGDPSAAWPTECYADRYMGGKRGVGLILTLSGPKSGTISVDSLNAPYQLEFYSSTGERPPGDLDGWSRSGDVHHAEQPGTVEASIDVAATHLLVWLRELGPDDACSNTNPYRGRLGEISYS